MALIEREHLLSDLAETYATAAAGQGRVALVDGGVASGKTRLVNAAAEVAAGDGALVLTAACSVAESGIRLGVVGQLFHSLRAQTATADHLPLLRRDDAPSGESGTPALRHGEAQLLEDVCQALLDVAADRTLVVVVDDVQFADPLSLQALLYLQRRIRFARMLLVVSGCVGARPEAAAFRAELTRQPHCRHLRLLPLSRDGVGRLLAERIRPEAAKQLAASAHLISGGNPMLVHALVDDSLAGGVVDAAPTVGESFVQAALACLHRSDPRLLDVARVLAIVGPSVSVGLVAGLVGLSAAAVRQVLGALAEAGLTQGHVYQHPAVRAAVLEDCPQQTQSALRSRAARLLHEDGASAAEVAAHLVGIGEPAEAWAAPVLVTAAGEAVAAGAVRYAVDCLDLALRSTRDGRVRAVAEAALVRAYWRADPEAVPRHLSSLLEAGRAGLLDEADTLLLARSLAWHGRHVDAEEALGGLGDLAAHPDPDLGADYLATRRWLRYCRPHGGDPVGSPGDDRGSPVDRAEEVLQRARAGDSLLVSVWDALRVLVHADHLDRAADWCEKLAEEAEAYEITSWRAVLSDVRAAIALCRGDLGVAERHARDALATMPPAAWGVAVGSPLAHLVLARTMTGQLPLAETALRESTPAAMRQSLFWPQYLRARGVYYDAVDRRHAALADFQTTGQLAVTWGVDDPGALPWRVDLARLHVRMGRPDRARKLVTEHLALPGGDAPRAKGMGLRALAAAYAPKQRQVMLREAMDLLHASGDRHELAHVFADLSQTGHALGEFGRAKMMSAHALQLAEGCHAELLRRKLRPAHDTLDPPVAGAREGLATLTDAERRVVNLAARGHTNREIGDRLFITVSTVEQHLTRAYRKLKISTRTELVHIDPPKGARGRRRRRDVAPAEPAGEP
ncbi:AAA family ATPase [Micromonospora echinofusca]|uniref:helix-turn-helix transcriptional regulator n=1 Tax=Micromonospora echinofusca TaxID=47858 RepID=UPI000C709884|nr:LuxR family transcriptional regulator [Micromonospora sp. MSM11]MCL7460824.1 AAA family ATPase [Micromonospora sp. MSM11]